MCEDGIVGGAVFIVTTENIDGDFYRSRKPMKAFKSPFLGKTDNEIRSWVRENLTDSDQFAERTFTILDDDTIKNKTCQIGHVGGDDRMLVTDFFSTLVVRIPVEESVASWHEQEFAGTANLLSRKFMKE